MIKYFCDLCGTEMEPKLSGKRLEAELKNVTVKCLVAVNNVWNCGHVCQSCIIRVVNEGEKKAALL